MTRVLAGLIGLFLLFGIVPMTGVARESHRGSFRLRSYTPRSFTPRSYTPRSYSRRSYQPGERRRRAYHPRVRYSALGRENRSWEAKHQFESSTGHPYGWPGHVVDHIRPLACGGADAPSNMQWQTKADAKAKDRTERGGFGKTARVHSSYSYSHGGARAGS